MSVRADPSISVLLVVTFFSFFSSFFFFFFFLRARGWRTPEKNRKGRTVWVRRLEKCTYFTSTIVGIALRKEKEHRKTGDTDRKKAPRTILDLQSLCVPTQETRLTENSSRMWDFDENLSEFREISRKCWNSAFSWKSFVQLYAVA